MAEFVNPFEDAKKDTVKTEGQKQSFVNPFEEPKQKQETVEDKKNVKPIDRLKAIGEETLTSGVFGAFTPEIMTGAGALAAAFPVTAPAAPFLMEAGMAARGARLGGAAIGAISGAVGETAGQAVESKYGSGGKAELARFVGSTFGPAPIEYLGTKTGKLLGSIAAPFIPGMKTAKTVGALLQDAGVDAASLSSEQKAFIERKLQEVRGGKNSLQAQKEVYEMLKEGASNIQSQAEMQASQLENQARIIIDQSQTKSGAIDQETTKRISNLQSQLNSAADKIRDEAQSKSKKVIEQSRKLADQITKQGESQSAATQQLQKIEADRIIARGQKEADDFINKANAQELRLRNYRDKVINITRGYKNTPQQAISAVGTPDLPTDRGNIIRSGFENVLNGLKETREKVIEKLKTNVFNAALNKEKSGQNISQTKSYENALNTIDAAIRNPETGLSNAPVGEIESQLKKIRGFLDKTEVMPDGTVMSRPVSSFEGLEKARRFLQDRASGLPAEGYDAIGQQQASLMAKEIEKIMEEFSPGFLAYKNAYREASVPINQFKTKLGKAVTGKPEGFDIGEYLSDPASLGDQAFRTRSTVEQLINILGNKQTETLARGYTADKLRNPSVKNVQTFLDNNRDWIGAFPKLKKDLQSAITNIAKAEKIGSQGSKLEQALNVKIGSVPLGLKTEARRIEEKSGREFQAALKQGETESQRIEREARTLAGREYTAGQTQADRIVTETERDIDKSASKVERQAGKLETEAEAQKKLIAKETEEKAVPLTKEAQALRDKAQKDADIILSSTTAPSRVRDIIMSNNAAELEATSKIILETPGGKEKFAEAVSQVIADRATKSLKGAIEDMKYIGDNLITYKLMTPQQVSEIQTKLQEIFIMPIENVEKITMAQKLVRNALISYVLPVPARVLDSVTK